jgi:PPOX class probable F420-dependent enzyme
MTDGVPEEFLRSHKQAVLATTRKQGAPHLTCVLQAYEDGKILISIAEDRVKYRNLVRDPRASVLVLGDNFWQYLVVEGTATLIRMPEAREPLRRYYELAAGKPHENWAEYDQAMQNEKRVLLELSIERLYGQGYG